MTKQLSATLPAAEAFGFRVNPGTIEQYLDFTGAVITERRKLCLFDHNLHSLYLYFRDPALRALYDDATIMIDGMPIVLLLRLTGYEVERRHRITWVDYIWPLLHRAEERGWRVFYLGSSDATCRGALLTIRTRLPRIAIAGHDGYFDATPGSADNARIVKTINDFGTDLCIVGMGTPRQQHWIGAHRPLIDAPVMVFCGACMEFVAGVAPTPPRWAGRVGLEWAFRLLADPRRFARRYLVEPWALAALLAANWARSRAPRGDLARRTRGRL